MQLALCEDEGFEFEKVVFDNDELKKKFGDSILTYRSVRCRRP